MLRQSAPFPNVGSWALWEHGGKTLAVRIQLRRGDDALISIPSMFGIASGNRNVALAELLDPTPLEPQERAELEALERKVAGRARPRKADVARADALRLRDIHARALQQLLEKLPARHVPEAAAARAA